jgi:NADH:ubiquinone reductase (H+-translocating)
MMSSAARPRVVIIGAGFAGLEAAKRLAGADVSITIVDRRNFHLFQPLLYQVATAALNPSDIAQPIRAVFRRQRNVERVLLGEVVDVHPDERTVELDGGERIAYEYLMIATGATHSYFGRDDWQRRAPGLKTLEDALVMRRRILDAFERAERSPQQREEYLTFVVVGAGPTGVELAGAMIEIAVHALRAEFDAIDPTQARVVLVEAGPDVLATYPPSLRASALRQLRSLGVEVRTGSPVVEMDERCVRMADGTSIATRTVLWAAGVKASPLGAALGAPLDRAGRVHVGPDLSVPGRPEIFVAGDLAAIENDGRPVPGVAPAAIQQGRHVAHAIRAELRSTSRPVFRYHDRGSLATIGRARAVADLPRLRFDGWPAWMAWLLIHVFFLIGFRNRVFVLLSWAWNYVTFKRGARIITDIENEEPRAR